MHINEDTLRHLAMKGPPPDKEGVLLKRGAQHKTWLERRFVLKGNMLFYFELHKLDPSGVIILEGFKIRMAEGKKTPFGFELYFGEKHRVYELAARTESDLRSWMEAIASSSYAFRRQQVSELQNRVVELKALLAAKADGTEQARVASLKRSSPPVPMRRAPVPPTAPPASSKTPSPNTRFNPFDDEGSSGSAAKENLALSLQPLQVQAPAAPSRPPPRPPRSCAAPALRPDFLQYHRLVGDQIQDMMSRANACPFGSAPSLAAPAPSLAAPVQ